LFVQEECVDANRFDALTRTIGEQTTRRTMLKTAAGSALAALGMGALGRVALGQDVAVESNGFKGDKCKKNKDCKKGLQCKNKKCKYKHGCGGKKGDACKNNGDCCGGFKCKGKKCKKK